jgi:undecaprenyl-diphosphatase
VQRHPVELVRVVLGSAVIGMGFQIAQRGKLPVFERDLFRSSTISRRLPSRSSGP